jgi:hypothetical protein
MNFGDIFQQIVGSGAGNVRAQKKFIFNLFI